MRFAPWSRLRIQRDSRGRPVCEECGTAGGVLAILYGAGLLVTGVWHLADGGFRVDWEEGIVCLVCVLAGLALAAFAERTLLRRRRVTFDREAQTVLVVTTNLLRRERRAAPYRDLRLRMHPWRPAFFHALSSDAWALVLNLPGDQIVFSTGSFESIRDQAEELTDASGLEHRRAAEVIERLM